MLHGFMVQTIANRLGINLERAEEAPALGAPLIARLWKAINPPHAADSGTELQRFSPACRPFRRTRPSAADSRLG